MRQAVPHVGEGRDLLGQHVQGGFDLRRSGGERPGRESSEKSHGREEGVGDMPQKRGVRGGAGARTPLRSSARGKLPRFEKEPLQRPHCRRHRRNDGETPSP